MRALHAENLAARLALRSHYRNQKSAAAWLLTESKICRNYFRGFFLPSHALAIRRVREWKRE
jgi:hypothetical protein